MDVNTGRIFNLSSEEIKKLSDIFTDDLIAIEEKEMTKKQKKTQKFSLRDHKSVLGKKLTNIRRKCKMGRNELCSCGSGKKYKKCCLKS